MFDISKENQKQKQHNMKKLITALLIGSSLFSYAQETQNFGIKFSGFVKTDFFTDSREVVNSREGHFLLYPYAESLDANGDDIRAHQNTNFLSIQSRLTGKITGPDAFGAKTSGVLEADFFGNGTDVNGFRLRHAFAKLSWTKTELLMGQYWNPMFVAECFPGVVSFNTGSPFQPFARNPQIRLSQKMGDVKAILAASTQRDFTSTGPNGASSEYLRNSAIPNLHAQLQYNPDSTNHVFGAGVDYKSLLPQTSTTGTATYASDERINSLSAIAYAKLDGKKFTVKMEGVYAQNATDLVMIGGYAEKTAADATTGAVEYTNLQTASAWIDMNTKGKKVQFGLFGGYTENLGAEDDIKGNIYARGSNIDYVYRVAPRVVFIAGKMNLALEVEHTVAAYGTTDTDGTVKDSEEVGNTRGLFSCIYKF